MRLVAATATVLTTIALATASAGAAIDPGNGIAGIEVGMTADEIVAAKGAPDADRTIKYPGQDGRRLRYGKTKALFANTADDARPWQIFTTSPAQRTKRGAGVGWTEERLSSEIARLRCGNPGGFRICTIGPIPRSDTTFYISKRTKRVTRVSIFR
jgi:hypothetical protein